MPQAMVDRSFSAGISLNPGVAEHAGAHPDRVGAGRRARAVMVLGTSSGAGKSWLATALCRWYARQGLRVAPFKAQNMSNNARVVSGIGALVPGGEIGSAQYFQALAAQARPDVRMNPLLLKPERDTHSQVVLMGRVDSVLTATPWRGRSVRVWPVVAGALDALMAENDVVVIEGAGSPAEINLADMDIVNMRVAAHADAACLLVTDIDRGGAFAHLYGTWALLAPHERRRIRGFVLNKFRGDASLLEPGPRLLFERTGVPTVATLPMWRGHGLPEEDGIFDERASAGAGGAVERRVAVVAFPHVSNLDEFALLGAVPGLALSWVRTPSELATLGPHDWIVLPGSKSTSHDLAWMRRLGLDHAVAAHAARGGPVLGICAGMQMLGEALIDPHGIDGNGPGLGLLPLVTEFAPDKTVRHTRAAFGAVQAPWHALSGLDVAGYEIHHGQTRLHPAMVTAGHGAHAVMAHDLAWQNKDGNVLGIYVHGLFEQSSVMQAMFGVAAKTLDSVFDALAHYVQAHFEPGVLDALLQ